MVEHELNGTRGELTGNLVLPLASSGSEFGRYRKPSEGIGRYRSVKIFLEVVVGSKFRRTGRRGPDVNQLEHLRL